MLKKKHPYKLSIITICYNEPNIEKTCESIINQTWQDFEWIVIDGGSTDGTLEILNKYKTRINKLISEPDKGIYNALNKGIKFAKGEWLNFMNGGDRFCDNLVLEKVFKNNTYNEDILYGWQYLEKSKKYRKFRDNIDKNYLCSNALGHQAMFFKRSCFKKFGLYNESFKIYGDFEKNVCFMSNNLKFKYLNYPISIFSEDGISSHGPIDITKNEIIKIYKKYYSDEEVLKYGRPYCKPYFEDKIKKKQLRKNFIKNIFSVRNENIRKIITILGLKFKIKSKKLIEKERYNNILQKENTIIEFQKKLYNQITLKNHKQELNFRTVAQLTDLIRNKISILSDFDLIVGIPRSGIIPAYLIALFLNKNVCSINEFINNLIPQKGERPVNTSNNQSKKRVLIVDDSIYTGNALNKTKKLLKDIDYTKYDIKYCAIYAKEESKDLVDYYFEIVSSPRMFQWNYLNHVNAKISCYDMDGVLCVDPTDEQNDDGEKYIEFIKNAKPLYIPCYKINSIVTSRLEKYRDITVEWLKKHNVQYDKLYMLNLNTAEERRRLGCHADFKASIYKEKTDCTLFIESNRAQAKKFANLTGKQTICVETDEYFNG